MTPLGLFSSVSAIAKILFQETWCRDMQWEEILPHDIGSCWHVWITSLPLLAGIHIRCWMGTSNGHDIQIHAFCDASKRAYGAVLYVWSSTHEGVIVRLACCKNRLVPVKKITLPHLKAPRHACRSEATALLLPRDRLGHQGRYVMDWCYRSSELDT